MGEDIIKLQGITKVFPGVVANDHIDLSVRRGEIHSLAGENGAGKSTLMGILYGLQQPDEGTILLRGEEVRLASPKDAIRHGLGMVHQHFMEPFSPASTMSRKSSHRALQRRWPPSAAAPQPSAPPRTGRCSLIWSILSGGWTNATEVSPIFIWFF